jgi:hypothetical protein
MAGQTENRRDPAFITGSWRFQHRRQSAATVIEGP